jgi:hypothetical protein
MSKAKFERSKPHLNTGTIGHVDHGKTLLLPRQLPRSPQLSSFPNSSPAAPSPCEIRHHAGRVI